MKQWSSSSELVRSWGFRNGISTERVAILNAIWEKELGHFSRQWKLKGIRRGVLYVVPRSSGAALELKMRSAEIIRTLNKYFKQGWIKGLRTTVG